MPPPRALAPFPGVVDVTLRWSGTETHRLVDGHLLGAPTVAPGDTGSSTLRVRNDGPTAALLTATIVDSDLLDPDHQDDIYDHILINGWPMARLVIEHLAVHRVEIPPGGTADLPFWYEVPASGIRTDHSPHRVTWAVHLHLRAALPG